MSMLRSLAPRLGRAAAPSSSRLLAARALSSSSSTPAPATTPTPTPTAEQTSKYTLPNGLELKGTVIAAGRMAQTVSVQVERRMTDHKTLKEFSRHTKFLVHDPANACVVGDQVLIRNCRPVSARKRFELVKVTKGARERVESHHAPQGGAAPAQASTTA
ncbi:hypothetical protein JCM10908_005232 [Rhodotorula pacifica]|uniref:uS17 family ribosomal protein n=1 Tax=Rhodotorula pacifica TaxID=1495444 RepID=UPI00317E2470